MKFRITKDRFCSVCLENFEGAQGIELEWHQTFITNEGPIIYLKCIHFEEDEDE